MSLAGRARTRGALLAVYRPAESAAADGTPTLTYALVGRVRAPLDGIDQELAAQLFGVEAQSTLRASVPLVGRALPDVQLQDAVAVESGPLAGTRYRVTGLRPELARPRLAHVAVGLTSTPEAFP